MGKASFFVIIPVFSIVTLLSCSKTGGDTPAPPAIDCNGAANSWATDVSPIIQTFCNKSGCHDVASSNGPGPLTNFAQVFSARSLIKDQVSAGLMPQDRTLTKTQKEAIVCWINSGAPNN